MNAGRFLKKSVPAFGQVNKKVIARSYVSKTLIRSGGAPHGDAHGDGHDDGHHHAHPVCSLIFFFLQKRFIILFRTHSCGNMEVGVLLIKPPLDSLYGVHSSAVSH